MVNLDNLIKSMSKKNLTDLSRKSGVSLRVINGIKNKEKGYTNPRIETINKISDALKNTKNRK
jgi:predicted transcriptional regulator|tara:strand:+ start:327 stop:515 length:189 start_codon:yes stop_codon:yes gene_type:complete